MDNLIWLIHFPLYYQIFHPSEIYRDVGSHVSLLLHQFWDATPSDGKQYGGSAIVIIHTMNEGCSYDTNNDGIVDVADIVKVVDYIMKRD